MSVLDDPEKEQRLYEEQLFENVNNLCEQAWILGIEITEIKLKDSFIQDIGQFGYGDKLTLKAPTVTMLTTDFGRVKIVK